ncbi:MAG: hypothetical protein E3K37_15480 [Candidatus Kuenenia sp.]|nr:hypothetical protein [Candidatus Kuenenia hertensis]
MKYLFIITIFICSFRASFLFALPADDVIPLVDQDYYSQVHRAMKEAKKSIFCVMYSANINPKYTKRKEYQLIDDLVDAHKRGVNVTVIFEKNIAFWAKGTKGRTIDKKSQKAYELLKEKGVPVFYDSIKTITHSKILVIDNYITILGSTNWTYSALNENHEASVMIKSKNVAESFLAALNTISKE